MEQDGRTTVQVIADAAGVRINPQVHDELVRDMEYRVREVIQEASKFVRHGKRMKMTTGDIDSAFRSRNIEPLFGYSSEVPVEYERVGSALYAERDEPVILAQAMGERPTKAPLDMSLSMHWLSVEGVQPAILQNPPPSKDDETRMDKKPKLVKHVLLREMQIYLQKVTITLEDGSDKKEYKAVLKSLEEDQGLYQLIPYLVQMVTKGVMDHLVHLDALTRYMETVRALMNNPYLQLDAYAHALFPVVLTCVVGRRLCQKGTDDHWSLRDMAALLVGDMVERFEQSHITLRSRVTKTLSRAFLDPSMPMTSHYGAIRCLARLGPRVSEVLILPHIPSYMAMLKNALDSKQRIRRTEAQHVRTALRDATRTFLELVCADLDGEGRKAKCGEYEEVIKVLGSEVMP